MNPSSDIKAILNDCIHCGLCLPTCPTYAETGLEAESPRGRIMLMDMALHKTYTDAHVVQHHLSSCLGCYTCETVCPSGINYGSLKTQTEQTLGRRKLPIKIQLLLSLTTSPKLLRLFHHIGKLFQQFKLMSVFQHFIPALQGLPTLSPPIKLANTHSYMGEYKGTVSLFTGCIMNELYGDIHRKTIHILRWNGYTVNIPQDQGCCGALHHHAGKIKDAHHLRSQNTKTFEENNPIIVNAAGCGAELKQSALAEKVKDINEFLFSIDLKPPPKKLNLDAVFDSPCHLVHAQKISIEPLKILDMFIHNVRDFPQSDLCCGAAGSYTLEHPQMSDNILRTKLDDIKRVMDSGKIITSNPGCEMQLEKGVQQYKLNYTVLHIVDIIHQAYMQDSSYAGMYKK